jgi:hypothetical protein
MSKCRWVDPLPILSLLISLADFKYKNANRKCSILFSGDIKSQGTLLSFLDREGFFEIMKEYKIEYLFGSKEYSDIIRKEIEKQDQKLSYVNCSISPAVIINLKTDEDTSTYDRQDMPLFQANKDVIAEEKKKQNIDEYVSRLINENAIHDKIPTWSFEIICMKLDHILHELIENVAEHAYAKDSGLKLAGIYIRYRYGTQNTSLTDAQQSDLVSLSEKECYENKLTKNYEECGYLCLSSSMITDNEGFIEIFVIDSGIGLAGTMPEVDKKEAGRSFFDLFQDVYFRGKRGKYKKKNKSTDRGGLHLIQSILSNDDDYVFTHEKKEWIGFKSSTEGVNISDHYAKDRDGKIFNEKTISGLSWIFRLTWQIANVRENKQIKYHIDADKTGCSHPVYKALENAETDFSYDEVFLIDLRKNVKNSKNKLSFEEASRKKYCLMFPSAINNKKEIIDMLEYSDAVFRLQYFFACENLRKAFFDRCENNKTQEWKWFVDNLKARNRYAVEEQIEFILDKRTEKRIRSYSLKIFQEELNEKLPDSMKLFFVIVDIPSHEMIAYMNILSVLYVSKLSSFCMLFSRIIICSKHYEVIAYSISSENKKPVKDNSFENDFLECTGLAKNFNIASVAKYLRHYDSAIFWNILANKEDKEYYFLKANIQWNKEIVIKNYLFFENIISDPDFYWLFINSLERLVGLFSKKEIHFFGSDTLVEQIVSELNNTFYKRREKRIININSIFVTGTTAANLVIPDESDCLVVNFFALPYISLAVKSLCPHTLFEWCTEEWAGKHFSESKTSFQRIENTHFLKKVNNNSLIIQRDEISSTYKKDIQGTYDDIQKKGIGIVRLGHYHYDGYHDFFNIKQKMIFETDSRLPTEGVFSYLLKTIFYSLLPLNANKDIMSYINKVKDEKWQKELKAQYETDRNSYIWRDIAYILFPTHYFTSLIMREILNILPDEMAKNIIPVNRVPSKDGTVISISPKSMELLNDRISQLNEKHDVVFFDTLLESGRTRKAIKHILLSKPLGDKINEIKTLSIIDSQKLSGSLPDSKTRRAYWRLDLPRLGRKDTCKLCQSLSIIEGIKRAAWRANRKVKGPFNTKWILNRLDTWRINWGAIPALENNVSHGISVSSFDAFETDDINKSFAPTITTNIGLAVYAMEMECLDLRNNIIEEIIEKKMKENNEFIVLLISCRLVLYGDYTMTSYHIKMLEKLFSALIKIPKENIYSALGCLALLTQSNFHLERAFFSSINNKGKINNVDLYSDSINNDLKILLGYLSQSENMERLYIKLPYKILDPFDDKKRLNAYRDFHYELVNEGGNYHDRPIQQFISYPSDDKLYHAMLSANTMAKMLEFILPDNSSELENILDKIDNFSKQGSSVQWKNGEDAQRKNNVKETAKDLLNELKIIHAKYFLPISNSSSESYGKLSKKIKKIINDCKDQIIIEYKQEDKFSYVITEIPKCPLDAAIQQWCIWNKDIESEFVEFIYNVRHCCGALITDSGKRIHMHISINSNRKTEDGDKFCVVTLRNLSLDSHEHYKDEIKKKYRPEMKRVRELGVDIKQMSMKCSKNNHFDLFYPEENFYNFKIEFKVPILRPDLQGED